MVLFTEAETILLLDLYLRLRLWPRNVASNGILLRAPARAELTRAINRAAGDRAGRSWTEAQVFVKFKNLRIEYGLVRWLREQPGFRRTGMSDDWWANIKSLRPKAHVFKGRLPWPFFTRMAMILLDIPYEPVTDPLMVQRLSELLEEDAETVAAALVAAPVMVTSAPGSGESSDDEGSEPPAPQSPPVLPAPTSADPQFYSPRQGSATKRSHPEAQAPPPQQTKRGRVSTSNGSSPEAVDATATEAAAPAAASASAVAAVAAAAGATTPDRQDSLARSVEQCAAAAAGMARGFHELVGVFQQQTLKRQEMEAGGAGDDELRDQRHVVLSIAKSLEQSTQATADMAKGYHDLVQHYILEGSARRS